MGHQECDLQCTFFYISQSLLICNPSMESMLATVNTPRKHQYDIIPCNTINAQGISGHALDASDVQKTSFGQQGENNKSTIGLGCPVMAGRGVRVGDVRKGRREHPRGNNQDKITIH
jgi:hypothetical protein